MISIIVCTYNREKYLYDTLCKIAENDYPVSKYELLLVDNNSTDGTKMLCEKFSEKYKQVDFSYILETRQGLSFARNRGIAEAKFKYLVFLDDDSFVSVDYLKNLDSCLSQHPDAMAWGGKIDPVFESGACPNWICKWTYSWVSAIDMGSRVVLFQGKKFPIGANMGFNRAVIEECGMFDTSLGRNKKNLMAGEEKDMFERVKNSGNKVYYFPNVMVHHMIPPERTTHSYVARMGTGVGASERLRCQRIGKLCLFKRCISELVKWGATFALFALYLFKLHPACGKMLIVFRYNVSLSLFGLRKID